RDLLFPEPRREPCSGVEQEAQHEVEYVNRTRELRTADDQRCRDERYRRHQIDLEDSHQVRKSEIRPPPLPVLPQRDEHEELHCQRHRQAMVEERKLARWNRKIKSQEECDPQRQTDQRHAGGGGYHGPRHDQSAHQPTRAKAKTGLRFSRAIRRTVCATYRTWASVIAGYSGNDTRRGYSSKAR